ncbi:uncharacterized protein 6-like [Haliotis cracherodii]|uniref:uncharacterized protein 6-like n=1 Tax=Haliotis cracherodii TaxID=6455 RepID=UPI0039EB5F9F
MNSLLLATALACLGHVLLAQTSPAASIKASWTRVVTPTVTAKERAVINDAAKTIKFVAPSRALASVGLKSNAEYIEYNTEMFAVKLFDRPVKTCFIFNGTNVLDTFSATSADLQARVQVNPGMEKQFMTLTTPMDAASQATLNTANPFIATECAATTYIDTTELSAGSTAPANSEVVTFPTLWGKLTLYIL